MGIMALIAGTLITAAVSEARAGALFDKPTTPRTEWRRVCLKPDTWRYFSNGKPAAEIGAVDNGWRWSAGNAQGIEREFEDAQECAVENVK
jgi:hypothetical protein